MRTIVALLAAAATAGGAWLFTNRVEIRGLEDVRFAPRGAPSAFEMQSTGLSETAPKLERLRIGSIDLSGFDEAKAAKPEVMEQLAQVVRQFDIVALQGIRSASETPLTQLAAAASSPARRCQHLLSPVVSRTGSRERFAFLYDTQVVEIDPTENYVVNDPHDRLECDPFVAWFRTRGVPSETAFTFTLVAVRVDPAKTFEELDALADVFVRVRNDGRGEDDVVLLGNLNADDRNLGRLGDLPRVASAISGTPTSTRGDLQLENLVFDGRATNEFTGSVGVFDFLREFNLTLGDAVEIAEHLPVWAEFSVYEGGRPRPVVRATNERGARRNFKSAAGR